MTSRIDDRSRFVATLREHPDHEKMAAFARRVFERLGERSVTSAGRDAVGAVADELGIGQELTVEGVRLRGVLERGAESKEEWAVLVALALPRIGAELSAEPNLARARKLVRHADALEWLGVDVYGYFDAALDPTALGAALDAMVDQTIEDIGRGRSGRAHALPRVEALAASVHPKAATARARLAHRLPQGALRTCLEAASAPGAPAPSSRSLHVTARTRPAPPRSGFWGALRLVSGLALLQWLGRGLLALAGMRTSAELTIDTESITVESRTELGGRVVRRSRERFGRAALLSAAHATRFPALQLLVGALALAVGIVLGGWLLADGVQSGETFLLLVGAGLALGGGLLDLLLAVAVPAARGRSTLSLELAPRRSLRLVDVPVDDAEAAVEAVARLRAGSEPT